jgi:hypothetical protein
MYRLIMVLSSLDTLKVNIIITLAHIAPQPVSGTELTHLLGYSPKARTIYRGVLDELEEMELINVNKVQHTYSISANRSHPIMAELIDLALDHGGGYANNLLGLLEDM